VLWLLLGLLWVLASFLLSLSRCSFCIFSLYLEVPLTFNKI
jgi:hypothetical protein